MGCARGQAGVRTVDEDVLAVVHGEAPRGTRADVWIVVQRAVDKRRRRRRVRLEVRLPETRGQRYELLVDVIRQAYVPSRSG